VEGVDPASPKATVRDSLAAGILSDADARLALQMVDDRNLTVHTYNEALAQMIYARLAAYAAAMTRWVDVMDSRLSAL